MSTKIPNGFRIAAADGAPPNLFDIARQCSDQLGGTLLVRFAQVVAGLAVVTIDQEAAGPEGWHDHETDIPYPRARPLIYHAHDLVRYHHRQAQVSGRRSPRYDMQANVVFFADTEDPATVYARLGCEQTAYIEAFKEVPGVEWWPYWNDTDDLPDGVTPDEWETRRETWLRVLGGCGGAYLTWRLIDYDVPSADDVLALVPAVIPTRQQRAETLAARWCPPVAAVEGGGVIYLDPDEVAVSRKAKAAELEPRLPEITRAHLAGE